MATDNVTSKVIIDKLKNDTTLTIFISPTETELISLYTEQANKHNDNIMNNMYPNSGFDLFVPQESIMAPKSTSWINMNIKAELWTTNVTNVTNVTKPYYLYPRSSISKTPLLLANSVGIIDCGYRGYLIGALYNMNDEPYTVNKHVKLLQICLPTLEVFTVKISTEISEMTDTSRGGNGFGSTS